ncbi:hypothetical protein [Vibrio parahaemolyticus]|nr:hypothetical protein [Vibrio parahaemolyticus]
MNKKHLDSIKNEESNNDYFEVRELTEEELTLICGGSSKSVSIQ